MKEIELKELIGGALQEQFARAFENVIDNLQNPNTSYKNCREITIKLKFVQNELRDDVRCAVQVSEKLAPQTPMETSFAIGKDLKTGKIFAEEYGKQVRGQLSFNDVENTETVEEIDVDKETGEIKTAKVVDLRAACR